MDLVWTSTVRHRIRLAVPSEVPGDGVPIVVRKTAAPTPSGSPEETRTSELTRGPLSTTPGRKGPRGNLDPPGRKTGDSSLPFCGSCLGPTSLRPVPTRTLTGPEGSVGPDSSLGSVRRMDVDGLEAVSTVFVCYPL